MSKCPHHALRKDLPPLTPRIAKLPVDKRGYPIPFFVAYVNGEPEFRAADGEKRHRCLKFGLCWCCGQPLDRTRTFAIGPMCAITRTTSEPANHPDCAEWSVKGCPFLSKPQMVRREDEFTEKYKDTAPGIMIDRNPGVTCLWTTKAFKQFSDGRGKKLIEVGLPISVSWWREGRAALRAEVLESIETGLPLLREHCSGHGDFEDLERRTQKILQYLPIA